MPSKTSKPRTSPRSRSKSGQDSSESESELEVRKTESGCTEAKLTGLAQELAGQVRAGDRILLEGPMGVGKTFFARALLAALKISQPAEGSPTFAIAHEYSAPLGRVVHVDFYRLSSEGEIEEAGIEAYFWDKDALVIAEWTSMWPGFEAAVLRGGRCWSVRIAFAEQESERSVEITPPISAEK